jgi:hypothetical protein
MRSSTIANATINNTVKTVADNDNNEKNVNVFFERKIEEATEGLSPYYSRILFEKISQENALIIAQYIFDLRREINPSDPYRMSLLFSDVNFLVFTKRGKRLGLARELAFVAEDERMRSKINHLVFDETPTKNSSSVPTLSSSDIQNARINRRSFNTPDELKEAIISEAYWQLRRLSPVLSSR